MSDVFISYSRNDSKFVRMLFDLLEQKGFEPWVDWEDIPKGASWLDEIYAGIEAANAFLFIISSSSLISEVCNQEVVHAIKHNKRIIPVLRSEIQEKLLAGEWFEKDWEHTARSNWQFLKHVNWVFFRETDDVNASLQILLDTLNVDLDYVKAHTRLIVRAIEWNTQDRQPEFLLRGMDLNSAEQWLAESETKMPKPTELQTQFILAGIVERQREEAAQREKQARKENLITILSHELQTPIAAMNAGISLIKRELQKNKYDRIEGFIDQVSDSIIKMQNLIEDTLHVTQLDKERGELDLGWVCLQDLISDILARRRKQIQYMDTQISTDMPNDPVQIYTDSSELAAVLTSLIVNGIHRALNDYKGSVSAVTVSIEAKNPTTVAIHVQDTGKNIPEDEIASVFEPFSTADLSTSRMKLYVAKQVTQKLGGTINVKSDIGKATSFSIVLPVQQDV